MSADMLGMVIATPFVNAVSPFTTFKNDAVSGMLIVGGERPKKPHEKHGHGLKNKQESHGNMLNVLPENSLRESSKRHDS